MVELGAVKSSNTETADLRSDEIIFFASIVPFLARASIRDFPSLLIPSKSLHRPLLDKTP